MSKPELISKTSKRIFCDYHDLVSATWKWGNLKVPTKFKTFVFNDTLKNIEHIEDKDNYSPFEKI